MVYTYDEIIAVLQTEGEALEDKKNEFRNERYNQRLDGVYIDYNSRDRKSEANQREILMNMTPEEYESERLSQAMKLYNAYKSNRLWAIMPGKDSAASIRTIRTSIDKVREVTGALAERGIHNTSVLCLDRKTILGIDALAWAEWQIGNNEIKISGINSHQLLDVVDDLIATRDIIAQNYTPEGKFAPDIRTIATQTNLLKRSIGFKKNKNVYGIEDYSVTAEQMIANKTSLVKKVYKLLKEKWKEFNGDLNRPSPFPRFGDTEIDLDDGEGR